MSKKEIPDTIYRAKIRGAEVTAIYRSNEAFDGTEDPLRVECADEAVRSAVLAAFDRDWEAADRLGAYLHPEGVLLSVMEDLAGGENAVEIVQAPNLDEYFLS